MSGRRARRVGKRLRGVGRATGRRDIERALWVAVLVALVADTVSTLAGLRLGYTEGNPVARAALAGGPAGLVALKAVVAGVALSCRPLLDGASRLAAPAALALTWTVAACLNASLILSG